MDELAALALALLAWRLVLVTGLGIAIALLLAWLVPGFGAGLGALLVFAAFVVGFFWQMVSRRPAIGKPRTEQLTMTRPVAFLGLMIIGFMWGGLIEYATGSTALAAGVLLVSPFLLGPIAGVITERPIYLRSLVFAAAALLCGLSVPWVINAALP